MTVLDLPSWTPTVDQVAAHIMARTRQPNGTLAGTFNSLTTPTDAQVQALVNQVVMLLAPRLGDVPDALADMANTIASMKSACAVERSYFMEQVASGASPHDGIKDDVAGALTMWDDAATGDEPNAIHQASMPIGTLYPGYATGTY